MSKFTPMWTILCMNVALVVYAGLSEEETETSLLPTFWTNIFVGLLAMGFF